MATVCDFTQEEITEAESSSKVTFADTCEPQLQLMTTQLYPTAEDWGKTKLIHRRRRIRLSKRCKKVFTTRKLVSLAVVATRKPMNPYHLSKFRATKAKFQPTFSFDGFSSSTSGSQVSLCH